MTDKSVLIITEANQKVATGHLMEAIELAAHLRLMMWDVRVLVNSDAPVELKDRLGNCIGEYEFNIDYSKSEVFRTVKDCDPNIIVTDLREVENKWIAELKKVTDAYVICIDEWGHRRLDADCIINPMIDPVFWDYKGSVAKFYCGEQYLILPVKLGEYHRRSKNVNEVVKNVCISMGGVDPLDTTGKIIDSVVEEYRDVKWHIVLGAGNRNSEKIKQRLKEYNNAFVYHNIDYIYDLFYEADIALCAGGNTLHELACIGTPSIVIPTAKHEHNNGKAFEKRGFGVCMDMAEAVHKEQMTEVFQRFFEFQPRLEMSQAGKKICDGDGARRVLEIMDEYA